MESQKRYYWDEGEISLVDYECLLCRHQISGDTSQCQMLEQIPQEVLDGTIQCPFFARQGGVEL